MKAEVVSSANYGTLQNSGSEEEEEEGVDGFHDRSVQSNAREALWSPPVDYLNDDRQLNAPYRDIMARREARKLAVRKRSSSFVVEPSRLTTATFNLTNTIIGSGTLAMPYAAMSSGLFIFPFLVAVTGLAANYAVHCLFTAVENLNGNLSDLGRI